MELFILTNSATDYTVREELFNGKKHIVVPVTMMVEGVHHGSGGPLYYPSEELQRFTAAWNGRPVVVNHPTDEDGDYISANEPGTSEKEEIGKIFNTIFEGNALKGEAWIEEDKLSRLSPDTLQMIMEHQAIEVSVGVMADHENVQGNWHDEHYEAIARNYRPDHLALLPNAVGACSWEDGCGIRVNKKMKLNYKGVESTEWKQPELKDFGVESWETLNTSEKTKISKHFLAGSSSAGSFEELKAPVINPKTGNLNKKALLDVLKDDVKQPVKRNAYALLNSEFGGIKLPDNIIDEKLKSFDIIINETELKELTNDIFRLVDSMDSEMAIHYCEAVYEDYFIYRKINRNTNKEIYYKQGYSVENNEVMLDGEPSEVKKNIEYTIVNGIIKNDNMATKCKIDELISNEGTKFEEKDRGWLEGLEDSALEKLMPDKVEAKPKETEEPPTANVKEEIEKYLSGLSDEEKMSFLSEDAQTTLKEAKKLREQKRSNLIKEITDNSDFTKEELEEETTERLEKLSKIIPSKTDYSGLGGVVMNSDEDDEEILAMTGYLKQHENGHKDKN